MKKLTKEQRLVCLKLSKLPCWVCGAVGTAVLRDEILVARTWAVSLEGLKPPTEEQTAASKCYEIACSSCKCCLDNVDDDLALDMLVEILEG